MSFYEGTEGPPATCASLVKHGPLCKQYPMQKKRGVFLKSSRPIFHHLTVFYSLRIKPGM